MPTLNGPATSCVRISLLLAGALLCSIGCLSTAADRPALQEFFGDEHYSDVKISPSGKYLAAAIHRPQSGSFRVVTRDDYTIKISIDMGDGNQVDSIHWILDDTVVITSSRLIDRYEGFIPVCCASRINVETGEMSRQGRFTILSIRHEEPKAQLISYQYKNRTWAHQLLREPGGKRIKSALRTGSFVFDEYRNVVFSIGLNEKNETQVHQLQDKDKWSLIQSTGYREKGWIPLTFGPAPDTFYTIDHRDANTSGLGLYNIQTGQHKPIYRHDIANVEGWISDFYGNLVAVIVNHHRPTVVYIDESNPIAQAHKVLSRQFPEDTVGITSTTRENKALVINVRGDRNPGQFYVVDLEAGKADFIGEKKPNLQRKQLGLMGGVEIPTRDNQRIFGYLTSAATTPKPGPMVVEVHGGPYDIRDSWGYNRHVQIYASQGYHVLQVNFRGSGGYGIDYRNQGLREWGKLMQDDISDATRWAIDTGIADPSRICISGASYGGYAALMGVATEPDLYKCAIGRSGVYDLSLHLRAGDVRLRRSGQNYLKTVLNTMDRKTLRTFSPVYKAENIKAAVFLSQGALDRRTPPTHSKRMRNALRKAGNPPVWHWAGGQGHTFFGDKANLKLYTAILEFLNEHIGDGATT